MSEKSVFLFSLSYYTWRMGDGLPPLPAPAAVPGDAEGGDGEEHGPERVERDTMVHFCEMMPILKTFSPRRRVHEMTMLEKMKFAALEFGVMNNTPETQRRWR